MPFAAADPASRLVGASTSIGEGKGGLPPAPTAEPPLPPAARGREDAGPTDPCPSACAGAGGGGDADLARGCAAAAAWAAAAAAAEAIAAATGSTKMDTWQMA